MATTTSFALSDHFREFARKKVAEGRYESTSEVIRAGLRLLEAEEKKFEELRAAIQEGIDSGPPEPFDMEEFIRSRRPR